MIACRHLLCPIGYKSKLYSTDQGMNSIPKFYFNLLEGYQHLYRLPENIKLSIDIERAV